MTTAEATAAASAADLALAATIRAAARQLAAADAVLAALAERYKPPELRRDPRLFRTLVNAIISQQLSGAGAAAIMRRVEGLFAADEPLHAAGLAARSAD